VGDDSTDDKPGSKPIEFGPPRLPNRLDLWRGPIVITNTLGKFDSAGFPLQNPLKGYNGFITSVNQHTKPPVGSNHEAQFLGHCRLLENEPDRDSLFVTRNKLDLRPTWKPAIPISPSEYTGSPPALKRYTREGTSFPDDDEARDLTGVWDPRASDVDVAGDGWEFDRSGWTVPRRGQNETCR
jgi:hypothetical protein